MLMPDDFKGLLQDFLDVSVSLEEDCGNQQPILIFQVTFSSIAQDFLAENETVRTSEPPVVEPIGQRPFSVSTQNGPD